MHMYSRAYECDNCAEPICSFEQDYCSETCRVEAEMRAAANPDEPIGYALGPAAKRERPIGKNGVYEPYGYALADSTPRSDGLHDVVVGQYVLPTDSEERKQIPIFSGVLNYFPLAIAAVARVSKRGNDKHNPGQPLHWSRGKSMDHADCIARHLIDVETVDPKTGEYEDAQALAWRALAKLQELEETRLGKPISRGSSVDDDDAYCGAI